MKDRRETRGTLRWILSALLIAASLTGVWGWGRVAQLAEAQPGDAPHAMPVLYAAWQPTEGARTVLYRSEDQGATWNPVVLPSGIAAPVVWADDGVERLAVALSDGSVLRSDDRGETWQVIATQLAVLSLAWDRHGGLFLGTDAEGIYRHTLQGGLEAIPVRPELAGQPVDRLAVAGGRLYAATPVGLFASSDAGQSWTPALALPARVSALVAVDAQTLYAGTGAAGLFRSTDGGQTWQAAQGGLGAAAGQFVSIDALRADPAEPGVLYASVGYLVGGTQLHYSAAGSFVTLDGGTSWLPMAGPGFPQAQRARDLVVLPGKPLEVQAVTASGLQSYAPDVEAALAAMQSDDALARLNAARLLGVVRAQGATELLLAALSDPDPAVAQASAEALGRIDDPAAASSLLLALQQPDRQIQRNAARALGMMGVETAVEPLRAMLLRGEPDMVGAAADALQRIGSPAAVEALLEALADRELTARRHAALAALERLGEPAVGALGTMLASGDVYARRNAAEALGWIGSPQATAALVKALRDGEAEVRSQAAWALGEVGGAEARAALERVQARDDSAAVREAAGLALSRIEQQPMVRTGWLQSWAPTLSRWQGLRWLMPVVALLAAMWLAVGPSRLLPVPSTQKARRR